jgi:FixJ family two-component response regulator
MPIQPELKPRHGSVAIVDDDASLRTSLARNLRLAGFQVSAFASAEDYLTSDQLVATDVLLADLRLEGMGGIELSQEVARRGMRTALVFMTAHSLQETARELEAIGSPRCLRKPFDARELRAAILCALKKRLATREGF